MRSHLNRERRVPIGWWRIAVLRWVFSRVTSGRLFLRTKRAEPGDAHNVSLRSEAPLSSSAHCKHLVERNTRSSGISGFVPLRRATSSSRKLTVSVELYDCWDASLKTKRDGADFKLHEQRATSLIWLLGAQELLRELTGAWNRAPRPTNTGITFKAV